MERCFGGREERGEGRDVIGERRRGRSIFLGLEVRLIVDVSGPPGRSIAGPGD